MLFPLKMCVEWLPDGLCKKAPFLVNANPRKLLHASKVTCETYDLRQRVAFSKAVTALSSGTTWKTTNANRHPRTDELILEACSGKRSIILDVGVSDGITALELIEKLNGRYEKYHVTDVSFSTEVIERNGKAYFCDNERNVSLVAAKAYLVYASLDGAVPPFNWLARRVLSSAPSYPTETSHQISLANPELRALAEKDPRIIIQDYSVFDPWRGTPPDIIKIANVLNRDYFSDELLRTALMNLKTCLKPEGMLCVTDNRKLEQVSTFVKSNDRLELRERINGGCSVSTLASDL